MNDVAIRPADARAPEARYVQIAGIRYAVRRDADGPPLWIPPATRRFLVDAFDGPPDVDVTCRWADLGDDARAGAGGARHRDRDGDGNGDGERAVFDSGGTWKLTEEDDGTYVFRFETPLLRPHPYRRARFSRDFARGEIAFHRPYFTPDRAFYPLEYPLDELVTVHLLAAGRGVELHACGLVDGGGVGRLFLGASGAGKSTTARLWLGEPGVRVLSDDRIVVRRGPDGRVWMYGTPWHGDAALADPDGAPISEIFLLRHGPRERLTPCAGAELVARLAACAFPTFHSATGLATTLRFLAAVAHEVPCFTLDFTPSRGAVAFVRDAHERRIAAPMERTP